MPTKHFEARLGTESGKELFVVVPFDVKEVFGKARPPVKVTINGYTYPSTVSVYDGTYYVPVRRSHRQAADVELGQTVNVTLELDRATRTVKTPPDLAKALAKSKKARAAWDKLSFTHRREHVEAIVGAKKPETRKRRIARALEMLRASK